MNSKSPWHTWHIERAPHAPLSLDIDGGYIEKDDCSTQALGADLVDESLFRFVEESNQNKVRTNHIYH